MPEKHQLSWYDDDCDVSDDEDAEDDSTAFEGMMDVLISII